MIGIKDMEMPTSCLECPLTYPRWDFNIGCKCCKAIIGHHGEYGEYKTKRHPDCPLIEIITCKDCVSRDTRTEKDGFAYCPKKGMDTHEEYFCPKGERKGKKI